MSERSEFLLGKFTFIKVVSLNTERGKKLSNALLTEGELPPFTSNEFLINYFIGRNKNNIAFYVPCYFILSLHMDFC